MNHTRRRAVLALGAFITLILIGISTGLYLHYQSGDTLPAQYYASQNKAAGSVPHLDHVVIILEENKPQTTIVGSQDAPYINTLAHTYATASHYYAVTHPSLPNYLALTSGTTAGITNDCNPPSAACQANIPNMTDAIEHAGRSWKAYMESMPAPCATNNAGNYAVKHNPFLYYPDIRTNASRCAAHDVPFTQLANDLATANSLPNYAFISPNLCNDMHSCSVSTGDAWLAQHVPAILHSPAFTTQHSLLVVVWDEGDSSDNNVLTIFAGTAAKRAFTSTTYYSHYSLLHTIEKSWNLPSLTTNDSAAPVMSDMLR